MKAGEIYVARTPDDDVHQHVTGHRFKVVRPDVHPFDKAIKVWRCQDLTDGTERLWPEASFGAELVLDV